MSLWCWNYDPLVRNSIEHQHDYPFLVCVDSIAEEMTWIMKCILWRTYMQGGGAGCCESWKLILLSSHLLSNMHDRCVIWKRNNSNNNSFNLWFFYFLQRFELKSGFPFFFYNSHCILKKRSGPRIDPWGMSELKELFHRKFTNCLRLGRKSLNQDIIMPLTP